MRWIGQEAGRWVGRGKEIERLGVVLEGREKSREEGKQKGNLAVAVGSGGQAACKVLTGFGRLEGV